jgi:hypothetical protein
MLAMPVIVDCVLQVFSSSFPSPPLVGACVYPICALATTGNGVMVGVRGYLSCAELTVTGPNGAAGTRRGVYLREPHTAARVSSHTVTITPALHEVGCLAGGYAPNCSHS